MTRGTQYSMAIVVHLPVRVISLTDLVMAAHTITLGIKRLFSDHKY